MKIKTRICTNCGDNHVDESKQTFIYRDPIEGNKWDACIRPLCDECIDTAEKIDEDGIIRLCTLKLRVADIERLIYVSVYSRMIVKESNKD